MWRLTVGLTRSEDLPSVATDALLRGHDSPALRELAGQSARDVRDNRDLFVAAIDELGLRVPPERDALWNLARETARAIVAGSVQPYDGARLIWWELWGRLEHDERLSLFAGLASEWEEAPTDRALIDAEITAYASTFVADLEGVA